MQNNDIRWIQRFNNFAKALAQLAKFITKGDLNELEKQGLIQCFEYTYELAWIRLKIFTKTRRKRTSKAKTPFVWLLKEGSLKMARLG